METDFKKETSPDKVISPERLSVFGRQERSQVTCKLIWHAGLGSEHAALGAAFEGQEL